MTTTLDEIQSCLSRPRLAFVGLSTDARDFSRAAQWIAQERR